MKEVLFTGITEGFKAKSKTIYLVANSELLSELSKTLIKRNRAFVTRSKGKIRYVEVL